MKISIIIPVWNGESVILQCLAALYQYVEAEQDLLLEVICVDNASLDRSAQLIQEHYPQVRLLSQNVNLGFAGGVNVGIKAAQGSIFILLNQDCLIESAILKLISNSFIKFPTAGIVGGTILNADGTINHTGAKLQRPLAYGRHLTEPTDNEPRYVDYVTGALFAIRRQTWDKIGPFDEGFYPRDHEETDYCYRARAHDLDVVYIPDVRARHLFSSDDWQTEPIRYTANQHQSRYRFIVKHFALRELTEFFVAEQADIQRQTHLDQLTGRVLAARHTLRNLDKIIERRHRDVNLTMSDSSKREIIVGFTIILRTALKLAKKITEEWTENNRPIFEPLPAIPLPSFQELSLDAANSNLSPLSLQSFAILKPFPVPDFSDLYQLEQRLLKQIFLQPNSEPDETTSLPVKIWHKILRILSLLSGREHRLLASLNTVHVWRLNQLENSYTQHLQHYNATLQHYNTALQHYNTALQQYQKNLDHYHEYIESLYALWQQQIEQLSNSAQYLDVHDHKLHYEISQNRYRLAQLINQIQILEDLTNYDYR